MSGLPPNQEDVATCQLGSTSKHIDLSANHGLLFSKSFRGLRQSMVSTKSTCNSPFSRPNIQAPLYQSCTFLAAFRTNLPKHCNFGTGVKDQQEFREAAERRERGAATTFHPQTACSTSFDKSKPQNGSPSAQMSAYNFKQSQYKNARALESVSPQIPDRTVNIACAPQTASQRNAWSSSWFWCDLPCRRAV